MVAWQKRSFPNYYLITRSIIRNLYDCIKLQIYWYFWCIAFVGIWVSFILQEVLTSVGQLQWNWSVMTWNFLPHSKVFWVSFFTHSLSFGLGTTCKHVFLTSGIEIGWDSKKSTIFGYFEKYVELMTMILPPCGQVGAAFFSIWVLLVMFWVFFLSPFIWIIHWIPSCYEPRRFQMMF